VFSMLSCTHTRVQHAFLHTHTHTHTHVFSMLSCTHTCFRKEDTSNKTNGPSTSFIATYVSELVFSDNQDVGATHRNHFAHQVNCKVELVHRIIMIISFLSLPEESITGNASLF